MKNSEENVPAWEDDDGLSFFFESTHISDNHKVSLPSTQNKYESRPGSITSVADYEEKLRETRKIGNPKAKWMDVYNESDSKPKIYSSILSWLESSVLQSTNSLMDKNIKSIEADALSYTSRKEHLFSVLFFGSLLIF